MKAMEKKTDALGTKNEADDAAALELMATPISETCANTRQICGEFEIFLKVREKIDRMLAVKYEWRSDGDT